MSEEWRALGAEAARCLTDGRFTEAAALFERVVALRPDHADSWFNLGYAQRHARDYAAALHSYGEALARDVGAPEEVHLNRAAILSEHLHRSDEALAELQQAVAKNPKSVAAWLNLGNLHEDLGDPDAARDAYQTALRAGPGSGRAIARLAAIDVHQGKPERSIAMIRDALPRIPAGSEDGAELRFALGSALEAGGDFGSAFAAVAEGNAIGAALRPAARRYDPRAQEHLVDALIAAFPEPAAAPATADDDRVIFICGMFRSGSTLTEQLLARHPAVTAGGELEFILAMVEEDLQPYPASLAALPPERIAGLRSKYLGQLEMLYPGASPVTDKRPDNFLHIGLVKTLFPGARIVHTVRQPLDNILSVYFLYFAASVSYSERLDDIVHYYGQYHRLMRHWEALYGADIFTVDYDALVADPKAVMEPLLGFLGLPWDDACLGSAPLDTAIRTASNWQVRRPLHARSSGRWRHYAEQLSAVRDQLLALGLVDAG